MTVVLKAITTFLSACKMIKLTIKLINNLFDGLKGTMFLDTS